ncbi:MAG: hypothetical protein HYX71_01170 [Opitutae bacterium]|nr:hypothetical protein [Opitutae bacterium]
MSNPPAISDKFQAQVDKELAAWPPRPDLWAYAEEVSPPADKAATRANYIRFRIAELRMAEAVSESVPSDRAETPSPAPGIAVTAAPQGFIGRFMWRAAGRVITQESLFNVILAGFVATLSFAALFLNNIGHRAWWLVLPLGQIINMYLAYRLSGYPLHLLATTRSAQARLQILLNVLVLTVLLLLFAVLIPLTHRLL